MLKYEILELYKKLYNKKIIIRNYVIIGILIGSILAAVLFNFFASYTAEVYIKNTTQFNILSWRDFQISIPSLVSKIYDERIKIDDNEFSVFSKSSSISKLIKPELSFSKASLKELIGIPKGVTDGEVLGLNGFTISVKAGTEEKARFKLQDLMSILKQVSIYYGVQSKVDVYRKEMGKLESIHQVKILDGKLRIEALKRKKESLMALGINNFSQDSKIFYANESALNYMPISNQLNAVNMEIININEQLFMAGKEANKIDYLNQFNSFSYSILNS